LDHESLINSWPWPIGGCCATVKKYIALYGAETWTLRAADQKYLESFEMWCWRRMEKISWIDHENGRLTGLVTSYAEMPSKASYRKKDKGRD
jgi:hypothetical protein